MNNGTSSADSSLTVIHPFVLWTAVVVVTAFTLALLVTTFLNRFFEPAADVYDDCSATDVKFLYSVRIQTNKPSDRFLDGKNSIIVVLEKGNVSLCRWRLRVPVRENALSRFSRKSSAYRLKFKVARNSEIKDVTSVRLEQTLFREKICIDSIEILDTSSGTTVFRADIRQPIGTLSVICGEDDRQLFTGTSNVSKLTPRQKDRRLRVRLTPVEYVIFVFFAVSVLMLCSVRSPHSSLHLDYWKAAANSFFGAVIAMTVTFPLFAVYKLLIRPNCSKSLTKASVPILISILTIILIILSVSRSEDDAKSVRASGSEGGSAGHMWLVGFLLGCVIILMGGCVFLYLLLLLVSVVQHQNSTTTPSNLRPGAAAVRPPPGTSAPSQSKGPSEKPTAQSTKT